MLSAVTNVSSRMFSSDLKLALGQCYLNRDSAFPKFYAKFV